MVLFRFLSIIFLCWLGYRFLSQIKCNNREKLFPYREKEDILEEDPVCGRLVPRKQAFTYKEGSSVYYFCSMECCNAYKKNKE